MMPLGALSKIICALSRKVAIIDIAVAQAGLSSASMVSWLIPPATQRAARRAQAGCMAMSRISADRLLPAHAKVSVVVGVSLRQLRKQA